MAKCLLLLFGIIVFQGCTKAAPSENSHPLLASVEPDARLDSEPRETHQTNDNDATQSQRQKRYYDYGLDYLPFDIPTFPFPSQPHHSKRDGSHNTAVYGTEDALGIIFRRLHEIVKEVRYQNVPRPVQTPTPAYIPIFYIPQFDCGCTSNNQGPAPPVNNPTPQPPPPSSSKPPPNIITTTPNANVSFDNRIGLDDKKRNWGILTNQVDSNAANSEGDGSRPINFDPIPPEEPMEVEVPPVDHGTVQAGAGPVQTPNKIPPRPQWLTKPATTSRPVSSPASSSQNSMPSLCDGAIITCCHRPQVTNKCFESLGCEDPSVYGNPCDSNVQLLVIDKFRSFQKRRSG